MSEAVVLVIDTATRNPTIALCRSGGQLIAERQWRTAQRHSEELLQEVDAALAEARLEQGALSAVIVGTGPGSFTGLRIGLATAKVIAYAKGLPIVGVSTTRALALAAAGESRDAALVVVMPAGAADRYVHRVSAAGDELEAPRLLAAGAEFDTAVADATLIAVDLEGDDIPPAAVARAELAVAGLAVALATLGVRALAEGRVDDPATLVPAYVALPRGIARAAAEMQWSPDLR